MSPTGCSSLYGGGGIRTVADAGSARAGADKVAVNTAAVRIPTWAASRRQLREPVRRGGVDSKRGEGRDVVMVTGGREATGRTAVEWAQELEARGAGEILLTSMDRDGTQAGYDLGLTAAVSGAVRIPVIASGGAGKLEDLADALAAGAHGVLAASIFHFRGSSLAEARAFLRSKGYPVRP